MKKTLLNIGLAMSFLTLSVQSYLFGGELTEEIFSAFGVAYSLNQLFIAKAT